MNVFLLLMVLIVLYDVRPAQANDCLNLCAKGHRRKGACASGVVDEWELVEYLVDPRLRPANVIYSGNCAALGLISLTHHQMVNHFGRKRPVVALTNGCLETTIRSKNTIPDTTCRPSPAPDAAAREVFWEAQDQLYDVTTLEFDIDIPTNCAPAFLYAFGSEEYDEFVGSALYSDAFKLLVDGLDLGYLAGGVKVSVKSVNAQENAGFFMENGEKSGARLAMEWDGATTLLQSTSAEGSGKAHVVLSIADVGDPAYDSALYLGRLTCTTLPTTSLKGFPHKKNKHSKHRHDPSFEDESKKRDVLEEAALEF